MIKISPLGLSVALLVMLAGQGVTAPNAPSTDMAAAAPVSPRDQPKPSQTARKPNDPNQLVCKTEEVTGSRLGGHRTCMTRAAWELQGEAAGDSVRSAQTDRALNANGQMGK